MWSITIYGMCSPEQCQSFLKESPLSTAVLIPPSIKVKYVRIEKRTHNKVEPVIRRDF